MSEVIMAHLCLTLHNQKDMLFTYKDNIHNSASKGRQCDYRFVCKKSKGQSD